MAAVLFLLLVTVAKCRTYRLLSIDNIAIFEETPTLMMTEAII